jgi:hypothetical protein
MRAFCLVLALCGGGGFVFWGGQASAAGEEPPTIPNTVATYITEHGAKLEAQINPHSSETKYELWLECANSEGTPCGPVAAQEQGGVLMPETGEQTVSVTMTGLQPDLHYSYGVAASNAAGKSQVHWGFSTQHLGACSGGICPMKSEVSLADYEGDRKYAGEAPTREAERQAKTVAAEQAEREAKSKMSGQASTPASTQTTPVDGSVALADASIRVIDGQVLRVRLACLGSQSCRGTLTFTVKAPAKSRKPGRVAIIGTGSYSIAGDEAKMVKVNIGAAGRALLAADRGRVRARLTIQELAPGPESTWARAVDLLQRRTRVKR